MKNRVKGYVVDQDSEARSSWVLKVTQNGHPENGEKFFLGSTRDKGLELATGLGVTFEIGSLVPGGNRKALDVTVTPVKKRKE